MDADRNHCRRVTPQLEARGGSAEDLRALSGKYFGVVYLNSVILWISDKQHVLEEIRRVLKPGGSVGFTTAAKDRDS